MVKIVTFKVIIYVTVFHQTWCAVLKGRRNEEEEKRRSCDTEHQVKYVKTLFLLIVVLAYIFSIKNINNYFSNKNYLKNISYVVYVVSYRLIIILAIKIILKKQSICSIYCFI